MSGECIDAPMSNVLLVEIPDEDFGGVSKTACIFIVVLDSLLTACIG